MTSGLTPRDAQDVESAVQWAVAHEKSLEIVGQGSKRGIGRPAQTDATLDLSGLSGITLYEPEELVLSAKAGTPLVEIEALVAANNQQLAFEPMDCAALLGGEPGGTIGGTIAVNLSGPRRIRAGAARDHFLGFTAVSGRGETFKSGGRVVKNVTGYDLSKLVAGSWGTLAVLTEVTLKVLPRPEAETTLTIWGVETAKAAEAMSAALGSSGEVSAAAHLPNTAAVRVLGLDPSDTADRGITLLRLEGVPPSIAHRRAALEGLLAPYGAVAVMEGANSRELWRRVRDVVPFAVDGPCGTWDVWRISTAPTHGPELARRIIAEAEAEAYFDWGGGLVWLAVAPRQDAGAAIVRRAVAVLGGSATLMRAGAAVRAAVAVFEPQEPALAALTKRVKDGFDPKGVLNPGRMYPGV